MAHGHVELTQEQTVIPQGHPWRTKLPLIAGVIGVGGLVLSYLAVMGHVVEAKAFFHSYLTAFLFTMSLSLGGLLFVLIQYVTRAGWSIVVRRVAENAMATLPLMAILFIPIVLGLHDLYHWSHHEAVAHDPVLKAKAGYLNEQFFYYRAGGYFVIWILLSFIYYRGSVKQDKSGDKKITRRLQNLSGPGIILTALTLTFAAFDWIMSLDPHWYSTIYGVYYFSGSLVAIFAFLSISIIAMQSAGLLEGVVTTEHYHDLGKLLFGFTVFWTYIAFSQYFLIWYANIPEETLWYAHRSVGSWQKMTTFMAVGHFVLPFFYFLTRSTKRHRFALLVGAMWMLMMHFIDMYWLVAPSLHHEGVVFGLIDVTTLLGIGGLFLAFFTWNLRRNPLVPIKDPRLQESLRFENF